MHVAPIADESKPAWVVASAMLLCSDMLDVKWDERCRLLWDMAVLAGVTGAPSHELTEAGIHLGGLLREEPASLQLNDRNDVESFDEVFVIGVFLRC